MESWDHGSFSQDFIVKLAKSGRVMLWSPGSCMEQYSLVSCESGAAEESPISRAAREVRHLSRKSAGTMAGHTAADSLKERLHKD